MINVVSEPVMPWEYDSLPELAIRMFETIRQFGGVGLAAPQIGIFKQVVMAQLDDESVITLINPEITRLYGKEIDGLEACLSIPPAGNLCMVPRLEYVDLEAASLEFPDKKKPYTFRLMSARIMQHEIDHLNGTFFIDRIPDRRRREVLTKFNDWKTARQARAEENDVSRPRSIDSKPRNLSEVRNRFETQNHQEQTRGDASRVLMHQR